MVQHVNGETVFVVGTLLQLVVAAGVIAFLPARRWI